MKPTPNIKDIISSAKVGAAIKELGDFLLSRFDFSSEHTAFVGLQTRGVILARRLAERIKREKGVDLPVGTLDITLYRDDVSTSHIQPTVKETDLDFGVDDRHIILVDDVLFTGRTIRAALDEIIDFGRPTSISLVVLVDRGHRELPIQADFSAIKLKTKRTESIDLHLSETDGKDEIVVSEAS